ncbi:MAG TPA: hypothetical protein PKA77_02995 [Chitinophagaceae bacterium]|jgi:hypothetical protein|nr:hypothetical protein [Chitinophagaceae bacterium]HMU56857.1 hypothetical protein [Chitinophagaceae bacterium]
MMRKTQILTWAVVFLAVTNAVTIGTILYHNYQESQEKTNVAINSADGSNMINGRYLRQTLGFDAEQIASFREINQQFRPAVYDLTILIDSLKTNMFSEMQKSSPDTVLLRKLSASIGEMHGQLKYETYNFFLRLKNICTPEQAKELEKTFQPLFKTEGITHPPYRHRYRGGFQKDS